MARILRIMVGAARAAKTNVVAAVDAIVAADICDQIDIVVWIGTNPVPCRRIVSRNPHSIGAAYPTVDDDRRITSTTGLGCTKAKGANFF